MMVPLAIILASLLIQSARCYNEDYYPVSENLENSYLYPDDFPDDSDFEIHRRNNNNNFLRFGRSGNRYEVDSDDEDFARPTRSKPEKNDHFIRFGRSKQDFLRFGRDQYRENRDRNANHLRFGRSLDETKRNKRDTYSEFKRAGGSNFLRFGRNSNFLRFGRNNDVSATNDPEKIHQESPLIQLLTELVENIKKENKPTRVV